MLLSYSRLLHYLWSGIVLFESRLGLVVKLYCKLYCKQQTWFKKDITDILKNERNENHMKDLQKTHLRMNFPKYTKNP